MQDYSLQGLIANLPKYDLLRLRNVKREATPEQAKQAVARDFKRMKSSPEEFCCTLKKWEEELGTTHAVLGGLLVVGSMVEGPWNDGVSFVRSLEGFELFEQICQRLDPLLNVEGVSDLERLYAKIKDGLIFRGASTNVYLGLQSFLANLDGGKERVGNCIVIAALFSLLVLRGGGMAGEGRGLGTTHSHAYFQKQKFLYDLAEGLHRPNLVPLRPDTGIILSGAFSFVATLLCFRTAMTLELGNLRHLSNIPKSQLNKFLCLLDFVEALNPYCSGIYELRSRIYMRLGKTGQEADNTEIANAMGQYDTLKIHGDFLPASYNRYTHSLLAEST
ncbi:MAG: hypothetical protein NT099_04390 [Candidatus Saganbacteria bacterium]|nr:hypothetical protein [Candidatus Saganbacteria bacterium]